MQIPHIQCIIDQRGNRIAVVVPIDEYNRMREALGEPGVPRSSESAETDLSAGSEDTEAYTEEEEQILKKRLKALGYL